MGDVGVIGKHLERAYRIARWRDDPWTSEGRERYERALKLFKRVLEHPWFRELREKGSLRILDLGAGRGIGGVALTRVLRGRGVETRLVMVDVREDAVRDAARFAQEEGVKAEVKVMDALDAYMLGRFDVILMYGAILAHFDEWALPRLFASAAESLEDCGLVIVEEVDRVNAIFTKGFKELMVEDDRPESLSISVHAGYEPLTGAYRRLFIRLRDWERVIVPLNFRSIAAVASLLWLFTEDVDVISLGGEGSYLVVGRGG